MKYSIIRLSVIEVILFIVGLAFAMPPAPDLLARIHSGNLTTPYSLLHERELRAAGYDAPHRVNLRHTTDDLDSIRFPSLVLLVDFSDHVAQTPASYFDSLLFGSAIGTVRNYFDEISYHTFTLTTYNYPSVIGWLRMPNTYAYYVNGQNGEGSYPQNAARMVEDAVLMANQYVDFSQYDYDFDGFVDNIFVIHAGTGAEYSGSDNDIWSHTSNVHVLPHVDGKLVLNYTTEPEFWQHSSDMTCGVFAHEMGHIVFDLPDLFDTDYSSNGLGLWCLMSYGGWGGTLGSSPSHPCAWARHVMGFANYTNVSAPLLHQSIPSVESSPSIFRVAANCSTSTSEYYLIENRQRTGYDLSLPGSGLLIYHVDSSVVTLNDNEWYPGHTNSGHYRIALEQADGRWDMEHNANYGDAGDPYPGSSVNRNFNMVSTPNSLSYRGWNTRVTVTGISNSDTVITTDLLTNGANISIETPNGGEFLGVGGIQTIRWIATSITGNKTIELNRNYPTGSWETIAASISSDSSYTWQITGDTTSHARIRVRTLTMTPEVSGSSNADFIIGMPRLDIITPHGNEFWTLGTSNTIQWSANGITGDKTIELNRQYPEGQWETVVARISNFSDYAWLVTGDTASRARIRVRTLDMSPAVSGISGSNFIISGPQITITSPHGGDFWTVGTNDTIRWSTKGVNGNKTIELNRHYPDGNWEPIASNIANDSIYVWHVSGDTSNHARIRIRTLAMTPEVSAISNGDFILGGPHLVLVHPHGGETFTITGWNWIGWSGAAITGFLAFELNRNYPTGSWESLGSYSASDHYFNWLVPGPATDNARIRVHTLQMASVFGDTSDSNFSIHMPSDVVSGSDLPTVFDVTEVYPNPFNSSTTIRFSLPERNNVTINIFDVSGREVTTLVHKTFNPGNYSLSFNGKNLSSGVYFVKMFAGKDVAMQKILLLK